MTFPFYEKALALFAKTQKQQIIKGLKKYPNAFDPNDWTPEELLNHALEETVDLTHYLVGLKDLLDMKDVQIKDLQSEIERLEKELNSPVSFKSLYRQTKKKLEKYEKHFRSMKESQEIFEDVLSFEYKNNEQNVTMPAPGEVFSFKGNTPVKPNMNFENHPYFDQDDQH